MISTVYTLIQLISMDFTDHPTNSVAPSERHWHPHSYFLQTPPSTVIIVNSSPGVLYVYVQVDINIHLLSHLINMDSFGSKSKIGKRFSTNSSPSSQEKMENIKMQLDELSKSLGTSKKSNNEDKGFVFSLSHFEQKNRESRGSSNKNEVSEATAVQSDKRESMDKNEESKRKMIYGNESYKEKYEEDFPTSVESNNDLFSMVFLNKAKKPQTAPPPPVAFSKAKSATKIEQFPEDAGMGVKDFDLGRKLGAGKFGEVYLARHRATGFMCALKKIDKTNVDSKLIVQLVREIKIQSFLNHPNVVKMYTFFADKNYIYLALELCFSGQLYNFLKKKRKVPEDMARFLVQQICRALDYMHSNEIIHRDLKPENVIYHCGLMKICDFGWSISTNTMRGTFCGTPLYVSPELLKRKTYNNKIDVWSVGILTYELLFGRVPFEITTEQDFMKIVEDEIKFSKATKVSDDAKDFILICLEKDPRDRFTIAELLDHPFLTQQQNVPLAELY